jgi:hypothetical protein
MKNIFILFSAIVFFSCSGTKNDSQTSDVNIQDKVADFAEFKLIANINDLSDNQKEMLSILFEVADIMDNLFWKQTYGSKENALALSDDSLTQKFIKINYGPWERLNGNKPFIPNVGEKPAGAKYYPADMTVDEFNTFSNPLKDTLYTILRRDKNGNLECIWYHEAYHEELKKASELLKNAAILAEDDGFKKYLELRAEALLTSDYLASDLAWMDMKTNRIDFVVGPIENYDDNLLNYKTAFESYILLKDLKWSEKLDRFSKLLPELQKKLPVEEVYKSEVPGSNSDLGAYEVVYYTGDCNAGSKTIAINLPNDPVVHKKKGSRRLQLKNAMEAKFEKILVPISKSLISPNQQKHITFNAFFENTMYHEVAHGLGIHHVINDSLTVSKALKEKASILEEGKADILGLFVIDELVKMGELDTDTKNNYVTFTAGLFRSIRFGTSSAHGVSNLIRYNYFKEHGAFTRDETGIYTVNFNKMGEAITSLTRQILMIQGNGDYDAASKFIKKYGLIDEALKTDLEKINNQNIPVDIVFDQGPANLGL